MSGTLECVPLSESRTHEYGHAKSENRRPCMVYSGCKVLEIDEDHAFDLARSYHEHLGGSRRHLDGGC
jgi:hypothetical protein